jgi:hypothetical protein
MASAVCDFPNLNLSIILFRTDFIIYFVIDLLYNINWGSSHHLYRWFSTPEYFPCKTKTKPESNSLKN